MRRLPIFAIALGAAASAQMGDKGVVPIEIPRRLAPVIGNRTYETLLNIPPARDPAEGLSNLNFQQSHGHARVSNYQDEREFRGVPDSNSRTDNLSLSYDALFHFRLVDRAVNGRKESAAGKSFPRAHEQNSNVDFDGTAKEAGKLPILWRNGSDGTGLRVNGPATLSKQN